MMVLLTTLALLTGEYSDLVIVFDDDYYTIDNAVILGDDGPDNLPEPAWYTQQIRITEQWTPETGWQEVARDTLFYEGCIGDWVNIEEVR